MTADLDRPEATATSPVSGKADLTGQVFRY
jgi:hypothetical protein